MINTPTTTPSVERGGWIREGIAFLGPGWARAPRHALDSQHSSQHLERIHRNGARLRAILLGLWIRSPAAAARATLEGAPIGREQDSFCRYVVGVLDPNVCVFNENEVARLLRVSLRSVQYWRRKGTGPPHFKAGKHVRYSRADLEAWVRVHLHPNGLREDQLPRLP